MVVVWSLVFHTAWKSDHFKTALYKFLYCGTILPCGTKSCREKPICKEYQCQRGKKWGGTSTCCFPWQSLRSMLEVTVTKVTVKRLGEIKGTWQLTSCLDFAVIALLTSSALLFYPLLSFSFNTLAQYSWHSSSVLSYLSSQIWAGHSACMYHHPSTEKELNLLSLCTLEWEKERWETLWS